jgi:hypothetical protein
MILNYYIGFHTISTSIKTIAFRKLFLFSSSDMQDTKSKFYPIASLDGAAVKPWFSLP